MFNKVFFGSKDRQKVANVLKQGGKISKDISMKECKLLTQDLQKVFEKYDKVKPMKGVAFLEDAGNYADEINAEFQNIVAGGFFKTTGQQRILVPLRTRNHIMKSSSLCKCCIVHITRNRPPPTILSLIILLRED